MVEMGENRTPRPEHDPRELPTGISGQLAISRRGPPTGGVPRLLSGVPLGSLTSLTGVGDAAPPLMTSSPSGEDGRRQCSLPKQRGRNYRCQLQQLPAFYEACEQPRPAIPGSRTLSKPDIPTNRLDVQSTRPVHRCERLFDSARDLLGCCVQRTDLRRKVPRPSVASHRNSRRRWEPNPGESRGPVR